MNRSSKFQNDPITLSTRTIIILSRDQKIGHEERRRRDSEPTSMSEMKKHHKNHEKMFFHIFSNIVLGSSGDKLAMFFVRFKGPTDL